MNEIVSLLSCFVNTKSTHLIGLLMPTRKKPAAQLSLLEPAFKTAPTVPAIKEAVREWRAENYKGATDTTRILLNYWFKTDHRTLAGRPFFFYDAQREAVETLIYLY